MKNLIIRDIHSFTLRRYIAILFVCLMGGAFEIHSILTLTTGARTADLYLICMVLLCLSTLFHAVTYGAPLRIKFPCMLFVIFGLLPFINFLVVIILHLSTFGTFSYMFNFAPYLTIFFWLATIRRQGISILNAAVKASAFIMGIRHLLAFFFPGFTLFNLNVSIYDYTYVYDYVGALPRVFGAGDEMLDLAILLYAGDWVRSRLSVSGAIGLCLAAAGALTTMDRGDISLIMLLIAVLLFLGQRYRTGRARRTLKAFARVYCLGIGILASAFALGSLANLVPGSEDRLSTNLSTFTYRESQVERAAETEKSFLNEVFGVGTQTFIKSGKNDTFGTINGLHFGFASIRWTFGYVGLSILVLSLMFALVQGRKVARSSPDLLEWYLGLVMFAIMGLYSQVFLIPGTPMGITICVAAIFGSLELSRRHDREMALAGGWPSDSNADVDQALESAFKQLNGSSSEFRTNA